jgi:hypothetical protein
MFTSDAAKLIGITPKALRAFLRTHAQGVGSGSRYEFSYDEVEQLRDDYWASQPKVTTTQRRQRDDEGTPGLPIQWLQDPDKHCHFIAERQERLERMSARLREVGLDVPQMTEHDLRVNNRAIARVLLEGAFK